MSPVLAGTIDVAQMCLIAFFIFFLGLVAYLRREDRREGYPLEDDATGRLFTPGGPLTEATPKTFRLRHGQGTVTTPTQGREPVKIAARRTARFPGAPLEPTGNPLVDGIGPAAWANRAKRPDLDWEGHPRIVPLRASGGLSIVKRDTDPRGLPVLGADGQKAGTVAELWVDRADRLVRYLEVTLVSGRTIIVPFNVSVVSGRQGVVKVDALNAAQFEEAPAIAAADTITLYEEERVQAYFGGGYLYATPERAEPLL